MDKEIEEEIQKRFNDFKIKVEYSHIHTYKITIFINALTLNIKSLLDKNIIKKTIVFDYDFLNNYMFTSNINQIEIEIKNLLRKEKIES